MKIGDLPATVTLEQAGHILGISRRTAYRAAARGQIPTIRIGRRWFVPTARLLDLLGLSPEDIDLSAQAPGPPVDGTIAAGPPADVRRSDPLIDPAHPS